MAYANQWTSMYSLSKPTGFRYKIPKGSSCWIVIDGTDVPILTERDVVYTEKDIELTTANEYHFTLPPNDRDATKLIIPKVHVQGDERPLIV